MHGYLKETPNPPGLTISYHPGQKIHSSGLEAVEGFPTTLSRLLVAALSPIVSSVFLESLASIEVGNKGGLQLIKSCW